MSDWWYWFGAWCFAFFAIPTAISLWRLRRKAAPAESALSKIDLSAYSVMLKAHYHDKTVDNLARDNLFMGMVKATERPARPAPTRWQRAKRWPASAWYSVWAWIHSKLPGYCDHDGCC